MKPPTQIHSHVRSFCLSISDKDPTFVPSKPLPGSPINECFSIVPQHIVTHGGKAHTGWSIWEWPGVMIEAELHMIWESPEGDLMDITPKPIDFDSILFLPDPKKEYRGRQFNNIRKPLVNSLLVRRYIETHNRIFVELNKGDLANYHGEIEPSK